LPRETAENFYFQPKSCNQKHDKKPKNVRLEALSGRFSKGSISLPWLSLLERNTGHTVPDWHEKQASQLRIQSQSEKIVAKLERAGIQCRAKMPYPVLAIGELTGQFELIEDRYRHIQIIPEVAQMDRRGMLRDLTYFLQHKGGRYCRYAVITSGDRVPWFGDAKGRRRTFHGSIRRWAYDARRRYGVELLFRSDEETFKEAGVHLHTNVIYRPIRKLSREEWSAFLSWSKQRLGGVQWKDCGRLKDPAEVVKYSMKLGSDPKNGCIGLEDLSSERLAWLHGQHMNAKLLQPVGSFADFRTELKEAGETIRRIHGGDLVRVRKPDAPTGKKKPSGGYAQTENVILGRMAPAPRFSGLTEPVTIVAGYTASPVSGLGRSGLDILETRREQAVRWAASKAQAGAEPFKVHTNTTSVQASEGDRKQRSRSERFDDPYGPSFRSHEPDQGFFRSPEH